MTWFPRRMALFLALAFILFIFLLAGNRLSFVDASHDLRAETFGREVLSSAPPDAIIFAKGDQAIFALWYFHFALKERPDVAIVAIELLGFDWYQQTLHSTYPGLQLPGPFPFAERMAALNPDHPVCFVGYVARAQIRCQTTSTPQR